MTLTLRAVSLNDHPLSRPLSAQFNAAGGSVGRGDHNTLALPDPERHISRQQAEISVNASGYQIRNVGSANPITVRGQALARGESAPLAHSDQIRIGGYLLEVVAEPELPGEALTDATVIHARTALSGVAAGVSAGVSARVSAGVSSRAEDPASPSPPASPRRALLPDDFNPFAPPPAAPPGPSAAPPPRHASDMGGFDDLIPKAAPASIDTLFKLGNASGRDPLADFMAEPVAGLAAVHASAPASAPAAVSPDPLALFGFTSDALPAALDAAAEGADSASADAHVPELRGAFVPPALRAEGAAPVTPANAPASAATAPASAPAAAAAFTPAPAPWRGEPHELWEAFCDGAALPAARAVDPEVMRAVGGVLRAAVAGTLQLMAVRASVKHELRAPVTVIQASQNNPLKFSPDARAALEQLLAPPQRGFLDAPEAMTDAMHDLVGHTLATMAGTRAALEGVLDRFAPQRLQAQLTPPSVLDSVLPMQRKARLWALYVQQFDALRDAAQDDFEALFGRAFRVAYEEQIERLRRPAEPVENVSSGA